MSSTNTGAGNTVNAVPNDFTEVPKRGPRRALLVGAYASLLLFMVVYCARPEDWIPVIAIIPLAKIMGVLALLGLIFSLGQFRFSFPREVTYLILLVGQLFLASVFSPVWKGGAVMQTIGFAKVLLIVVVMLAALNTPTRLRRLIFVQAASVAVIAAVAVWKGRMVIGRLEGTLGASYGDPNDLALVIIIALPLCLALLFLSRSVLQKIAWAVAVLVMLYTVLLTGSRGGFVALIVTTAVFLWQFAIRGRRRYLLVLAALAGVVLVLSTGGMVVGRLKGTFNVKEDTAAAYSSAEERQQLFWRSVELTKQHPLFGVGPGNFMQMSGIWHVTHNSYTQMSAEGGIPALVLYVLILWCGFKNLMATKRLARGRKESTIFARALLASLAGYAVGSVFLSLAYQFFPYFLVAYTTALLAIAKKSDTHSGRGKPGNQSEIEMKPAAGSAEEMLWQTN